MVSCMFVNNKALLEELVETNILSTFLLSTDLINFNGIFGRIFA